MSCMWRPYAAPGNPTTAAPGGGGQPSAMPGQPTVYPSPAPTSCMGAGVSCNASNFRNCCSQYCLGTGVCATVAPTSFPTPYPTRQPTQLPTPSPTKVPTTASPTLSPTPVPWTGYPVVNVILTFPDANDAGWTPEALLGNVTEGLIAYLGATDSRIRVINQTLLLIRLEILTPGYDSANRYVDLLNRRTTEQPQVADQSVIFGNRTQLGELLFSIEAAAAISPTVSPVFTPHPTPTPIVKSSNNNKAGVIAGVVVGLGGGLILLLLLFWYCRSKKGGGNAEPKQRAARKDGITFDKYKPAAPTGTKKKEVKVNV